MKNKINKESVSNFFKSTDFSKALVLTTAITFPIVLFIFLDKFEIGLAMGLGALLSSPSDVQGSFRHKVNGISLSAFLACICSILAGYAAFNIYILLPVLGLLMFGISYLAVFGFRASLVAFSGLFAIVLSFANISTVLEIWERAVFIGLGGLWYLALTIVYHFLNPKRQTEQLLAQGMELTAKYLEVRGNLLTNVSERENLQKQLILLQAELNDNHEHLREILISTRETSGNSNFSRKHLLIFIDLVDILELAMANPVDYSKMDTLMQSYPNQIEVFKKLIFAESSYLKHISKVLHKKEKIKESDLKKHLQDVEISNFNFREITDLIEGRQRLLFLRNFYDYQEKQVQKINGISRILNNLDQRSHVFLKNKEAETFITSQDYDPKILVNNFNFKSPILKHSLRLAVVVLIGFSIGIYFSIHNAYWILLTIIVIMRPNYGLTKERSKQRLFGTLIGAAIAVGIVYITQNKVLFSILGIVSLMLAFSMVQKNYKTSAIFITLSIVFIYSLLQPDILNVIQYRVIDTLIGAGLAALGNIVLWPSWESQQIKTNIFASINANKKYLDEIDKFYHEKGKLPTSYKLARKYAFLEMGNLSAAFQRMAQEPKSKRGELSKIYEIVSLNQTFLSSLASLGTYIRNHPTTKASNNFESIIDHIKLNLENSIYILENKEVLSSDQFKRDNAEELLMQNYSSLIEVRNSQIEAGKLKIDDDMRFKLQELQLVTDQLKWLLEISEKIQKPLKETVF